MTTLRDLGAIVLFGLLALGGGTGLARAETAGVGPEGQQVTVSQTEDLDPDGERITVSGTGFDENKGIYLAFCVMTDPDALPTPCGGGIDMEGDSGSSVWISSNPPPYGRGLAIPYGPGGSFEIELTVGSLIGDDHDCRVETCGVVTRADHTRSADRSQDVRLPVSFRAPAADLRSQIVQGGIWIGGGVLIGGLILGVILWQGRRSRPGSNGNGGPGAPGDLGAPGVPTSPPES